MYETIRIVGKLKPKYVMWENVKNLLSKKHIHNFNAYIEAMDELGYNSYYKVLNAKDYGIPQNRERVYTVSIRKDIDKGTFKFPEPMELKLRLKDMLESVVDKKYYLSDSAIKNLDRNFGSKAKEVKQDGICDTLQAAMGTGGGNVPVLRIGGIYDTDKSTQDSMQGGNRQQMILSAAMRGHYNNNGKILQRLEVRKDNNTNAITTVQKDNLIVEPLRIRKLTPKECWRLMGFNDEDFEKAEKVNSNTQLYKQAGNSIVVNVLVEILRGL